MTIRDFAKHFGYSIFLWSKIEREEIAKRTGEPVQVPDDVRADVTAFIEMNQDQAV